MEPGRVKEPSKDLSMDDLNFETVLDDYLNSDAEQVKEPSNFYYDFDDVPVPKEMELDSKESLMFETPHVKAGLLCFSGRVEPVSLFNFFRANMPKDGWQMRSYFKYGWYIIVFEKPEKDCILGITEGHLKTNLEIWVTPRVTGVMQSRP